MRRQRGLVGLMGLAALVGWGVSARLAEARVTTEQSASILVFPKVIATATRDTVIQITNTSNNMRHAHCFYVDGAPVNPDLPVGPLNPPRWVETDFDIWLTRQQPTHWVVSTGRWDDPTDDSCRAVPCNPANSGGNNGTADCCDAGFDPGRIPPMGPNFTGELKCVEVDASGFPVPGNSLKGEATLVDRDPNNTGLFDVSKYNAIGLKGFDTNNMDGVLCLGGAVSSSCPSGAEYEACPQTWILDTPSVNAENPVLASQEIESRADVQLTVVPCSENFETQVPTSVTLQFAITNEFEQTFSASTTITCWANYSLDEINPVFDVAAVGGNTLQTRVRAAAATPRGIMAVVEETVSADGRGSARVAHNPHNSFADQSGQDLIIIPADQIQVP
ncbi:MAG: hypothetical protein KatS3mg077_2782 [Candidatus Binatia bacterium]|nr:MAG: hypothetical protein KatS3mg077_2782 [Candidatus Binatia bacterium]